MTTITLYQVNIIDIYLYSFVITTVPLLKIKIFVIAWPFLTNFSFQPIVIAESSQVVKESASQPNDIAESSQVQHNIRFHDPRVSPPKEFALFLRKHPFQNITKCQEIYGKNIGNEDEMIIRSYGTSTWTSKVTGRENSKCGPMGIT